METPRVSSSLSAFADHVDHSDSNESVSSAQTSSAPETSVQSAQTSSVSFDRTPETNESDGMSFVASPLVNNTRPDRVRIIVVGDQGVGKTSLVHLLCHGKVKARTKWTVGCNAEVLIHDYRGRRYFVEIIDVGGSQKYILSRSMFYGNIDGLLLVHALDNIKSYHNLRKWLKEVLGTAEFRWSSSDPLSPGGWNGPGSGGVVAPSPFESQATPYRPDSGAIEFGNSSGRGGGGGGKSSPLMDASPRGGGGGGLKSPILEVEGRGSTLPVLMIGTRLDVTAPSSSFLASADPSNVEESDSLHVNSLNSGTFHPSTFVRQRLNQYLDRVITRRYFSSGLRNSPSSSSYGGGGVQRRDFDSHNGIDLGRGASPSRFPSRTSDTPSPWGSRDRGCVGDGVGVPANDGGGGGGYFTSIEVPEDSDRLF